MKQFVHFSQISQQFSGKPILDNTELEIESGKVILLTGKNGSGKTTLLRILSGLLAPKSATVNFGDGALTWKQARQQLIQNIMYLHQSPYMFLGDVYRNLSLATSDKISKQQQNHQTMEALKWAMLESHKYSPAGTLSGGQKQRLSLARAWIRKAPFILLDEPTANMDSNSESRTLQLLQKLKSDNVGIVISSHNPHLFHELQDKHLGLDKQKLQSLSQKKHTGNVTPITQERTKEAS